MTPSRRLLALAALLALALPSAAYAIQQEEETAGSLGNAEATTVVTIRNAEPADAEEQPAPEPEQLPPPVKADGQKVQEKPALADTGDDIDSLVAATMITATAATLATVTGLRMRRVER